MLRRALERLTRNLVFRRKLPREFQHAALYVSPSVGLKYLFKTMSAVDAPLLHCADMLVRPGDVVWDIGANIGLFSIAAAMRSGVTGKVISFEPDIWLVNLLRKSAASLPGSGAPITVLPVAVAREVAFRTLAIAVKSRACNALSGYGHEEMGGIAEEYVVPAFNLDWLAESLPHPAVVKIDVEGAELEVLERQAVVLSRIRPIVICEVGDKTSDPLTAIFASHGYNLYDGEKPLRGAPAISRACWNTVAIPKEKSGLITGSNVSWIR